MSREPRICLVEDDEIMGESLCDRFRLEGLALDWHRTAAAALKAIGGREYAVVISDIRLPDLDGGEMYRRLAEEHAALPPFLFITGYGSIDHAVALLKRGAADYITKPFDLDQLVEKVRSLAGARAGAPGVDATELGVSAVMRRIRESLPRLAKHASTVLLTGESGVGKEHVAQLFHRYASDKPDCPFVPVNCGALSETLLEAELFGYEKGAFTGALRTKKGLFEQAHCGTLFLDEIGEMSLAMQVKLLRALQEKQVVRVGGETPVPAQFRLVCATNRDLKRMVEEGAFREDLFYRVHVIHVRIPPLRERRDDILWFLQQFLDEFNRSAPGEGKLLDPRSEQPLLNYPWPGNIRELKHAVERACILATGPVLGVDTFFDDATAELATLEPAPGTLNDYLARCEHGYLQRALERNDWQIAQTAAELGISRKNLWEKLRKLGIRQPSNA